jgi:hypothetical protein
MQTRKRIVTKLKPYFEVIEHCDDKLELLVDNELWTLTNTENCYLQNSRTLIFYDKMPICIDRHLLFKRWFYCK